MAYYIYTIYLFLLLLPAVNCYLSLGFLPIICECVALAKYLVKARS